MVIEDAAVVAGMLVAMLLRRAEPAWQGGPASHERRRALTSRTGEL